MGMQGADIGQLRRLADRFAQGSERIESLRGTLTRQLDTAPWRGRDADRFRSEWRGPHAKALTDAANLLRGMSESLRTQAGQQEEASRADGGQVAGGGSRVSSSGATATAHRAPKESTPVVVPGPPSGMAPYGLWTPTDMTYPLNPGDWPDSGDPAAVAAWWNHLSETERSAWRAQYPTWVGNCDGIPYDERIRANRINLDRAIAEEKLALNRLETEGGNQEEIEKSRVLIKDWEKLASEYVDIQQPSNVAAAGGRKLLGFDPANSVHIELVGKLDDKTSAIGILVPGTNTSMANMQGTLEKAQSFVNASDGKLAMVAWVGGQMPQDAQALQNSYARDLGPKLASFVNGLDNPRHLPITAAGHSYGGSIVGAAEKSGMVVDRVLHIESAGAGPDVRSVNAYAKPDTPRYCLEAPGDYLLFGQGAQIGGLGHGADPSALDGMVNLNTGWIDDSDPSGGVLGGTDAHEGVFETRTTSWKNMYKVLMGEGEVELRNEYRPDQQYQGAAGKRGNSDPTTVPVQ